MPLSASQDTNPEALDFDWRALYRLGGVAAWILLVYSLVTMLIMVVWGPPPETVEDIFAMLQAHRWLGLLRLDLLTILCLPLYYPLFLALYAALRRAHGAYGALAALLGCAGVTLFLATPSLSLVPLSGRWAAATGEARLQLVAAGEALRAADMWHGTGAMVGGTLVQIATTLVSWLMLSSKAFAKSTAYVGLVTHGLDLLHIVVGFFFPGVGVILMAIAGPLYLVWFPLLARDFFRLRRRSTHG